MSYKAEVLKFEVFITFYNLYVSYLLSLWSIECYENPVLYFLSELLEI